MAGVAVRFGSAATLRSDSPAPRERYAAISALMRCTVPVTTPKRAAI
jgi:hypothetical protein